MALEWVWLRTGFGVADGGSYAKLFQGKGSASDVLAREVTQNSWDAAHRMKFCADGENETKNEVNFKMEYEFRELSGEDKANFSKAIQINELVTLIEKHKPASLGIESNTCLNHVDQDNVPLNLLYIHDYGTTGLRGDPVGEAMEDSDFYRAFGVIGGNDRDTGGGSFGFGKSAFIRASRIHCVIAYSSFPDEGDGVTRRLWGFLYWKGHDRKSGVAQLGTLQQAESKESVPLCNEAADEMALRLGFKKRGSATKEMCGTSLLIVDHVINPESLVESLEKFWWPAIYSFPNGFNVRVLTESEVLHLKPIQRSYLQPFIRAFEIATKPETEINPNDEFRPDWRALRGQDVHPGAMAIVRVNDVSNIEQLTDSSNPNLIALIRNPRMVVCYQPYGEGSPNVHGVFVADAGIDGYLRQSEPDSHNVWQKNIDGSYGDNWEKIKTIVEFVHKRIRDYVLQVKRSLRPQVERKPTSLNIADELLSKIFKPEGPGPVRRKKNGKKRSSSLADSELMFQKRLSVGQDAKIHEKWRVTLAAKAGQERTVQIVPKVRILADGSEASAADQISVNFKSIPSGFSSNADGSVIGILRQGEPIEFEFESEAYNRDWTVKSDPEITDPSFVLTANNSPGVEIGTSDE